MKAVEKVQWTESEWSDKGWAAYWKGYSADVTPDEFGGGWFWRVDVTAEISEYPECVDMGVQKLPSRAKARAAACLVRSARKSAKRKESRIEDLEELLNDMGDDNPTGVPVGSDTAKEMSAVADEIDRLKAQLEV